MTQAQGFIEAIRAEWPDAVVSYDASGDCVTISTSLPSLVPICGRFAGGNEYRLAAMTVRDEGRAWSVHYLFHSREAGGGWVSVAAAAEKSAEIPALSLEHHAADWLEREAEDHFGVRFKGHPRLGDFVFHDEEWHEGLAPMRKSFDPRIPQADRSQIRDWHPRRVLHTEGAFSMTVGPIYGGLSEPVHFLIETVGEEVVRVYPRLFFKYRALEKLAEGREIKSALLLAERFDALHAFSHSLAFCSAVERARGLQVPPRAQGLRVMLAELERVRSHVGTICAICGSTGLAVAESQFALLEEELLRLCGATAGHRYLFGLNTIGGLTVDVEDAACRTLAASLTALEGKMRSLEAGLVNSSSFLDRLEEVGVIDTKRAVEFGLAGPVARASGCPSDLRKSHPYSGYESYGFDAALQQEGDGYARLRVLFFEVEQSISILRQAIANLAPGPVRAEAIGGRTTRESGGMASATGQGRPAPADTFGFGWAETPGGAAVHLLWLLEDGTVDRYRIVPPSFFNWHGFHLAAEGFAFQDFPIILATFGLSVAESDR